MARCDLPVRDRVRRASRSLRDAFSEESSPLETTCENFITAPDAFLSAAQRDHRAHPWVRGRDLFLGVLETAWVSSKALIDDSSVTVLRAVQHAGWTTTAN
ncbi:hypothetical protein ASG84_25900 [Rhodococcus sp. Leaf278]|nr:hypothetical protein ASG84_25900 [Rhodococcus sp. Leaf278]